MSDKIKELMKIAGTDSSGKWMGVEHASKFAELIIRECCVALWTEECHTSDLAFEEVKRNSDRIKEHFGIDPTKITIAMLDKAIEQIEKLHNEMR